ncbi:MAG: hypothetical protein AAF092_10405 [Pseudomonadota bacterium]
MADNLNGVSGRAPVKARAVIAMVMALCGTAALSADCQFTTKCVEDAACEATNLALVVTKDDLLLDGKTYKVNGGGTPLLRVAVANSLSALHVVVYKPTGDARYSRHLFRGPKVETYLGSCE